ncbi:MAG: hypothetical protein ACRCWM_02625 [Sarcina sp.]
MKKLKKTNIYYSPLPVGYTAEYELKKGDENIAKIKEIYPSINVEEKYCKVKIESGVYQLVPSASVEIILNEMGDGFEFGVIFNRSKEFS